MAIVTILAIKIVMAIMIVLAIKTIKAIVTIIYYSGFKPGIEYKEVIAR